MTRIQKAILFLNYVGVGIFAPVLSLLLLGHGGTVSSLSILIGVYSATVIVAEVPSGMFADTRGRKKCFFVSVLFTSAGFIVMYLSGSLPALIPGVILFGCGAAFLSGSLDSLIIEDCIRRGGDAALPAATGAILLCQCAGIAAGALISSALPTGGGYLPHIAARLIVLLLTVLLCMRFLPEGEIQKQQCPSFRDQTKTVLSELKGKKHLQIVLICIFGSSISLFALETYWQLRLSELILQQQTYLLGILYALGYGGNMLGSFVASRLKLETTKKRWLCYLLFIALLGCVLALLAIQKKAAGFMAFYVLALLFLGVANVPEQTILNSQSSNEAHASLLSIASLSSKVSGVLSGALCAVIVLPLGISGVWIVMGAFTVLIALTVALRFKIGNACKAVRRRGRGLKRHFEQESNLFNNKYCILYLKYCIMYKTSGQTQQHQLKFSAETARDDRYCFSFDRLYREPFCCLFLKQPQFQWGGRGSA